MRCLFHFQTYFDHPPEERYTWCSENKTTKKVIDNVRIERYIQQFVQGCSVKSQMDFGSDHRLLLKEMHTASTRRARKSLKKQKLIQKLVNLKKNRSKLS